MRIIVLNINKKSHKPTTNITDEEDFIEYLANNPIKLNKDFKFDREEANKRLCD